MGSTLWMVWTVIGIIGGFMVGRLVGKVRSVALSVCVGICGALLGGCLSVVCGLFLWILVAASPKSGGDDQI